MSRPLTEPSTPLRRVVRVDDDYATYSAPIHTRVTRIPLLPQTLPKVLGEMSSRRTSLMRQKITPSRSGQPSPNPRETPQTRSVGSSRKHTPTRKVSDHLTIRRRRRSSTGVTYDSAFAGTVNKDFLRLFSRTLVREKKQQLLAEPDDQVYQALDKQHRISSASPRDPARDFNQSLPLPSEDEMNLSEDEVLPVDADEPGARTSSSPESVKPIFKSYLEQILESRQRNSRRNFDLAFEKESSEEAHPSKIRNTINTSKFTIENTLFGLPQTWDKQSQETPQMKLAEPVAFGLLNEDSFSDESSEKEKWTPPSERIYHSTRSPRIGLGNKTPESYDVQFDNIDQLDVPSWEPIPAYIDSATAKNEPDMDVSGGEINHKSLFSEVEPFKDSDKAGSVDSDSEVSESGIISGHFTVDNDNIIADSTPQLETSDTYDEPHYDVVLASSSRKQPSNSSQAISARTQDLSKKLVRGFITIAQHLPSLREQESNQPKKPKAHRLNSDIVSVVCQKSSEFLSHVMQDLSAYASHRHSDQINISDALLFLNRVKSRQNILGQDVEFPVLAQNIFPLELLVSLDNSLQESTKKPRTRRVKSDDQGLSD